MCNNDSAPSASRAHPEHIELPDPRLAPALIEHEVVPPFQMPSGQIDGLESIQSARLLRQGGQSPATERSSLLQLRMPGYTSPADLAFAAMQYLPTPLLILNNLKTVVMANEAMGKLMEIDGLDVEDIDDTMSDCGNSSTDKLRGKTLSQVGVDLLQDGRPVWVAWESFLEGIADDLGTHYDEIPAPSSDFQSEAGEGDVTPTGERNEPMRGEIQADKKHSMVHDAVVEVVIATGTISAKSFASKTRALPTRHILSKMIITIWEMEDERYFSLTFTSTDTSLGSLPSSRGQSRQVVRAAVHHSSSSGSGTHSHPSSVSSKSGSKSGSRSGSKAGSTPGSTPSTTSSSSAITSPSNMMMSTSSFPPLGPPSKAGLSSAPSHLQKLIMMKDALLDNTDVPILAMWKDESLTVPNKGKLHFLITCSYYC